MALGCSSSDFFWLGRLRSAADGESEQQTPGAHETNHVRMLADKVGFDNRADL
jgi:hypothetical protein